MFLKLMLNLPISGVYLFLQVQLPLSLANIKHKHFLLFGWGKAVILDVVLYTDKYSFAPILQKVANVRYNITKVLVEMFAFHKNVNLLFEASKGEELNRANIYQNP